MCDSWQLVSEPAAFLSSSKKYEKNEIFVGVMKCRNLVQENSQFMAVNLIKLDKCLHKNLKYVSSLKLGKLHKSQHISDKSQHKLYKRLHQLDKNQRILEKRWYKLNKSWYKLDKSQHKLDKSQQKLNKSWCKLDKFTDF